MLLILRDPSSRKLAEISAVQSALSQDPYIMPPITHLLLDYELLGDRSLLCTPALSALCTIDAN